MSVLEKFSNSLHFNETAILNLSLVLRLVFECFVLLQLFENFAHFIDLFMLLLVIDFFSVH